MPADLDFAADNSYDFVLFSYNGIDHLELPERERALIEMKRVLRPGGLMAFSSHNANFLPVVVDNYRFRLRAQPARNGAVAEMGDGVQLAQSDACAFACRSTSAWSTTGCMPSGRRASATSGPTCRPRHWPASA